MATYNKFYDFTEQLLRGNHDFDSHTFKVMLTNVAPVAGNTIKADIPEIASGNGYTAGGSTLALTITEVAGVATVRANEVTFTAAGGAIGPFRYAVIYNDTATNKPLVAWYDYGQLTLQDTETIVARFNNTNPGNVFTVS